MQIDSYREIRNDWQIGERMIYNNSITSRIRFFLSFLTKVIKLFTFKVRETEKQTDRQKDRE